MFRPSFFAVLRSATRAVNVQGRNRIQVPSAAPFRYQPAVRVYSVHIQLSKPEVEGRIVDLLKGIEKISDPTKVTPTADFYKDLGLDSLDAVEAVMAIEEEFSIEIPDKEADAIRSIPQAVAYILSQPDAH